MTIETTVTASFELQPLEQTAEESVLSTLFEAAADVRVRAHAPYSRFFVGAAVLDIDGRIHLGCNVENAAYPEGTCAEAGAIAVMVAAGGARHIRAVVVVGGPGDGDEVVCPPCGGCRQKIREFAAPGATVHLRDAKGSITSLTLEDLLPFSFGPEQL